MSQTNTQGLGAKARARHWCRSIGSTECRPPINARAQSSQKPLKRPGDSSVKRAVFGDGGLA